MWACSGRLADQVHAAQDAFYVDAFRLGWLGIGLVINSQVVVDVLRIWAKHSAQAVFENVPNLVAESRVISDHPRIGACEEQRVTIFMLQALTIKGGAARCSAKNKAPRHLIHCGPERVAGALETEHRIKNVERNHRLVLCRVGAPDGGKGRNRPGLVYPFMQDLTGGRLLIGEH